MLPLMIRSLTIVPLMPPVRSMLLTLYPASRYFAVCCSVLSATKTVLPPPGNNTFLRPSCSEISTPRGTSKSAALGTTVAPLDPAPAFANNTLASWLNTAVLYDDGSPSLILSLDPTKNTKSSGDIPIAAAASNILSCPAVIGAKPPHVIPIRFFTISTSSSPLFRLSLPLSVRPRTTDRSPNRSASNASPTALSLGTPVVDPGARPSAPTPVTSRLAL